MTKTITQKALNFLATFSNLVISAKTFEAEPLLEEELLPFSNSQRAESGASIQEMGIGAVQTNWT